MLTKPLSLRQVSLSLTPKQKIILSLLAAVLCVIPLWLGLERAHSAPAKSSIGPPPPPPVPNVTLDVPDEVLIGDTFKFKVTFDNTGPVAGYGPFVDVIMPTGGVDYTDPTGPCDGITFLSAEMIGVNGGPVPLTAYPLVAPPCSPNPSAPVCASQTHPYAANGINTILVPGSSQLVTIELPFGSFQPNQPPIVVQITAKVSKLADVNGQLNIFARGGFRFGTDASNNFGFDPPVLSLGGVAGCTVWNDSAPVTPVLFTFKVEDPLSANPGPCYDGADNGHDNLTDSKDPDCKHAKTYIGPEDETATGPNYPRQYKIILDIAAGQTVSNLTIQDCLPNNVVFTGIVSTQTVPAPNPVPPQPGPLNNNCLSFTYPNPITGTSATTDVVIVFEFYVPELDANGQPVLDPATCANALSPNDVKASVASGDWTPVDPRDPATAVTNDPPGVDHLLTDKHLAMQKSVKVVGNPNGPIPGDVLQYTLDFQISDFFTMGNLEINDFLSDGQLLTGPPPTLLVKDGFGSSPGSFTVNSNLLVTPNKKACCRFLTPAPGTDCTIRGGTDLNFKISSALSTFGTNPRHLAGILTGGQAFSPNPTTPATGRIVYYAKIQDTFAYSHPGDQFVDKDDPMTDCAIITGDIFKNVKPLLIPVTTDVKCEDDSRTEVRIVDGVLKKQIIAINGNTVLPSPLWVAAGDTITFKITMRIPSGDTEDLKFQDFLPLPVLGIGTLSGQLPTVHPPLILGLDIPLTGNINLGSTNNVPPVFAAGYTGNTADNSFTIKYLPNLNNPANTPPWNVDIRYTVTVSNAPFADGLFLTNEVQECESNTFKETFCQTAIAGFELTEPNVRIRKGVIATNNPNSVFTTFPNHLPSGVSVAALTTTGPSGGPPIWAPLFPWIKSSPALINPNVFNSDLKNADANDWITFAIVLENRGSGLHGAFGVRVKDTPHPAFVAPGSSWNVRGHDGRGAPFTLIPPVGPPGILALMTPGGKLLQDPGPPPILFDPGSLDHFNTSSGRNLAIITYNMQLRPANQITIGQCFNNTAELISYSATAGGPNFVSAGFTPPFTDAATVCINPTLEKSIVATSEGHTGPQTAPPGTPSVAIGEIVRYRLLVRLPEGSGPSFKVTDVLPAGMKFLNDNSARLAFISNGTLPLQRITHSAAFGPLFDVLGSAPLSSAVLNPLLAIPVSAISGGVNCGDPVTFDLGNVQNKDNDPDLEYVEIEFNALVCNQSSNHNGLPPLSDTFSVWVGGANIATSNPIDVSVVEPNLAISKVASPSTVTQGGTVNYTVTITNSPTADAFDVQFADTLPSGLTFVPASVNVTGSCLPFAGISIAAPLVSCDRVKANGVVTITYKAVANPPTCPTTLTNQATVTWTSLPGPKGTTPNLTLSNTNVVLGPSGANGANNGERNGVTPPPALNDYSATASAPLTVKCPPCVQAPPGLVAWWPFDEPNGATIVNDLALFNNQGTPKPVSPLGIAGAPSAVPGQVAGALSFNSAQQSNGPNIEVPDHPEINFGTGDLSIDAWVFVPKPPSVYIHPIVDKLVINSAGTQGTGYALYLVSTFATGARLQFVMGDGGPLANYLGPNAPSVPFSTWTHITVTVKRSPGTVVFYVNGSPLPVTGPPVPGSSIDNTLSLLMGESRLPGAGQAAITLDEVEMFNRVLLPQEIKSIFSAGSGGKCKCLMASNEAITCGPNGTFNYTFTLTNLSSFTASGVVFSPVSNVTISPVTIPQLLPGDSLTNVTVTIGGPDAVSGANVCFFVGLTGLPNMPFGCRTEHCITLPTCPIACATPPPGMVAWWPMNLQNGLVNDIAPPPDSLTNNVGNAPAYQPVFGNVGGASGALFFGGPLVQVSPQSELDFGTGDFSIDAWVRIVAVPTGVISPIVDKFTMPGGPGFAFYVKNQKLELNINGTTFVSTGPPMLFANPVANTGPWYHVAVTVQRSPAQLKFYINAGAPVGTFTAVPATSVNSGLPLWIGGTRLLPGTVRGGIAIDELELFNLVLTQTQIQSIVNAGSAGKCP